MKEPKPTKAAMDRMRRWGNDSRAAIIQINAALATLDLVKSHVARQVQFYVEVGVKPTDTLSRDIGVQLRQARRILIQARSNFDSLAKKADERLEKIILLRR